MNDSHEGLWLDRVVQTVLDKNSASMSDANRRDFVTGYQLNKPRPFIFCLSSEPDILSQWRAYSNDGTGVAIGYDASIFPRRQHFPSTNFAPAQNTALWEVIYESSDQQNAVNSLFDRGRASPDILVAEGGKPEYQLLGTLIAGLAPLIKNPAFREEKESRVIHTPRLMTNAENKHSLIGTSYTIGQRVSGDQIVTHFEFPLPEVLTGVIQEIWIGPRSRLTKSDIELSLSINGYGKVSVQMSSATYR